MSKSKSLVRDLLALMDAETSEFLTNVNINDQEFIFNVDNNGIFIKGKDLQLFYAKLEEIQTIIPHLSKMGDSDKLLYYTTDKSSSEEDYIFINLNKKEEFKNFKLDLQKILDDQQNQTEEIQQNSDISKLFDEFVSYRIGKMPSSEQDTELELKDKPVIFFTPVGSKSTLYKFVDKDEFLDFQEKIKDYKPKDGQCFFSFVNIYGRHWNLVKYSWNQDKNGWDEVEINCKGDGACGVHAMVNAVLNSDQLKEELLTKENGNDLNTKIFELKNSLEFELAIDFVVSIFQSIDSEQEVNKKFVKKMNMLKLTKGKAEEYWVDTEDIEIFAQVLGVASYNKNSFISNEEVKQKFNERKQTILENLQGKNNTKKYNYKAAEIIELEQFLTTIGRTQYIKNSIMDIVEFAEKQQIADDKSTNTYEYEDFESIIEMLRKRIDEEEDVNVKENLQIQLAIYLNKQEIYQKIVNEKDIFRIFGSLEESRIQQKKNNIILLCEVLCLRQIQTTIPHFIFDDSNNTIFIPSQLEKFTINDDKYLDDLQQKLIQLRQTLLDKVVIDDMEIKETIFLNKRSRSSSYNGDENEILSGSESGKSDDIFNTPVLKKQKVKTSTILTPGGSFRTSDTRGRTDIGP